MNAPTRTQLCLLFAFLLLWLSGCQTAATPAPTVAATGIPSFTFTHSPTGTDTPTITPTGTPTPSLTPTFTPTPPYNAPGTYRIYKCVGYYLAGAPISVTFCVTTVKVYEDFTMQFNVNWKVKAGYYRVTKYPDTDNQKMILEDNLGNIYHHFATGGCAAEIAIFQGEGDCNGWFLFNPAEAGATSFRFYDNDNMVFIDGIVLLNEAGSNAPDQTSAPSKPHPTVTPTPTPNPNLKYNEPGTYWLYKCKAYPAGGNFSGADSVTFCLNTVVVNEDRTMKFNITWKVLTTGDFIKASDANNPNIYLTDNLGNKYEHIQAGGCAAAEFRFYNPGNDCNGWFVFPAAQTGVTSFRYVDDGAFFFLDGIVMAKE